jgi:hypothetical protein
MNEIAKAQKEMYEDIKAQIEAKPETILVNKGDYFISFIEEGILNSEYEGYVGGRVEVYNDDVSEWAIEEIRFWTKDKGWYKFREKWDFRGVNKRQLDRLRATIKKKYYDN